MIICKLIGHNLNFQFNDMLFCARCGSSMKLSDSKPLFQDKPGKSQFLEAYPFKEKFANAKKITDVLK